MALRTNLTRTTHDDPVLRGITIVGLLTIAAVHLLDLPDTIQSTLWIGIGYLAIIAGAVFVAALLLHGSNRSTWLLTGLVAVAPLAGYLLTRTVGLPGDSADIGNWNDQLGILSLFAEALVVFVSMYGVALVSRARSGVVARQLREAA